MYVQYLSLGKVLHDNLGTVVVVVMCGSASSEIPMPWMLVISNRLGCLSIPVLFCIYATKAGSETIKRFFYVFCSQSIRYHLVCGQTTRFEPRRKGNAYVLASSHTCQHLERPPSRHLLSILVLGLSTQSSAPYFRQ